MNKRGFWSLSRKMVVLLVLASSLPVGLTAYLVYQQGRERVTSAAADHLGSIADASAQNLDAFIRRYERELVAMIAMPNVLAQCPQRIASGDALEAELRTLKSADSSLFGLSVVNADGVISASSDPIFVGLTVTDRAYYHGALASDDIAIEMVMSRGVRAEAAVVIAQRYGPPARPCVAIVAVSADELFASVRALNASMGGGGYIVLLDEHGIRIAHGTREDLVFRPAGQLPPVEAEHLIREKRFGTRTGELLAQVVDVPSLFEQARAPQVRRDAWRSYSPSNQERNLVVGRRLGSAPWTMFAHVPIRVVEAPVGSMLNSVLLVGGVMGVLAMLAGLIAARRVLGPIQELTRAARALASDGSARAAIDTSDEIGELARHFNRAAEQIAASSTRLEQTVAERTRELTASNEELNRRRDELIAHRTELITQTDELSAQRDELARKSTEVERADRMKSEFLANMSHELRTPLNSVIGFADLLQVTAEERLKPVERGYLGDIVAAGRHLLLIINDILDLAKIEAGHVRLAIEAVDPEELAAGAISMALGVARVRAIDLRLTVTARRRGRGDPDRLRQVLLNLLSNAVKFSPDNSAVDVRVDDDDDDHLTFAVTDRGTGITAEAQARLFQPFVQGEDPLVKRHQGTGLGLAISKKLVELHEGTLTVVSRPGVGSTFRFTIPAAGRRVQAMAPIPRGSTVLLVGAAGGLDNHRARLEPAGYQVVIGDPALDLIAQASQVSASLIVIDLDSLADDPIADAILRAAPRLSQRIPVILLSAEPQVLAAKPIDGPALQAICRRLVRRDDGPARVLVVDDDPRVAGLVAGTLGSRYRIDTAGTAAEGLAKARIGEHDLFVIDLMLPDGSGFDVLTALSDEPSLRTVPRIVLTAAELDPEQRARLRRHAHAVAHKGMVTPDELVHVVDRLALGRALRPAQPTEPKILVVDDNDMNRALARSILERLSYRVVEARDGIEAIVIAERERPALILMDLAMPGKDGFATTRELRAHAELGATPIVAVSALAMRSDEDRARAAGVDSFLAKPLDRDALERTVARYLNPGGPG